MHWGRRLVSVVVGWGLGGGEDEIGLGGGREVRG